ncbi:hypothetical protein [Arachidicoccus ginsenosidivorans]|uniref:hypothetical protein n=1 Tax=Arachidicoccus ginsenosidivorans TaxID=496057 RepID=UPI001CEF7DC2|nr:hypothetical protein [Arachidicoccus ginsenosidivorans]
MDKRWTILPTDPVHERALHAVLKINPVLCRLLVQRGYPTFEKARAFFRPSLADLHDPMLMKDMDKAVSRVLKALNDGEKILVYGIMMWTGQPRLPACIIFYPPFIRMCCFIYRTDTKKAMGSLK